MESLGTKRKPQLPRAEVHDERKKVNFTPTFIVVHLPGLVILLLSPVTRHLLAVTGATKQS